MNNLNILAALAGALPRCRSLAGNGHARVRCLASHPANTPIILKKAFQPRKNTKEHEKSVTYRSSVNYQNGEAGRICNALFFRVIFVFFRGQLGFLG
jgi:hypothetical protein